MNHRLNYLIQAVVRITRVMEYSYKIQPYYFLVVTLMRTAIRLLYLIASILPFKILLIVSTDYSIPAILAPYFSDKVSLAYTLCVFIGVAMVLTKVLEKGVENIARFKTKAILGDQYFRKKKRRNNLDGFIRRSTDVASSCMIVVFSIGLLFAIQYQIALVVIGLTLACLLTVLLAQGKLDLYVQGSPMKYIEACVTSISLVSFFTLFYISINSASPPPFLILLISLILIRQYTQSLNQIVSAALFFNHKDAFIERLFTKL